MTSYITKAPGMQVLGSLASEAANACYVVCDVPESWRVTETRTSHLQVAVTLCIQYGCQECLINGRVSWPEGAERGEGLVMLL